MFILSLLLLSVIIIQIFIISRRKIDYYDKNRFTIGKDENTFINVSTSSSSIAIISNVPTFFNLEDNKYIMNGNLYLSYLPINDSYIIVSSNEKTEWKIENNQISTRIKNENYYIMITMLKSSDVIIKYVTLSKTPSSIVIQ